MGFAPAEILAAYDGAGMADAPAAAGLLAVLEAPEPRNFRKPRFLADLSGAGRGVTDLGVTQVHGSYLVRRENVFLFGPNHLVDQAGRWSCESRSVKGQYIDYFQLPFYDGKFPGAKPVIERDAGRMVLRTSRLSDVELIEAPVFLATPVEPPNWGRWICTVLPKLMQFQEFADGRRFFCHAAEPWEGALCDLFGVTAERRLAHDPGRSFICRDVMTVEYSEADLAVSRREAEMFAQIAARFGRQRLSRVPKRIFVGRFGLSNANPQYRVLQNEAALAAALAQDGFVYVEPERLPFALQVTLFAQADEVVLLGGSAIFNAVFCKPGARIVTIESSDRYILAHARFLSSLELDYGVIFGCEDAADLQTNHRRWWVDVAAVRALLRDALG